MTIIECLPILISSSVLRTKIGLKTMLPLNDVNFKENMYPNYTVRELTIFNNLTGG